MIIIEPIEFKNGKGLTIRGVWQEGSQTKVIIMCHGFRSNLRSNGRFDRLASTFQQLGYHVLRFDFAGCGSSDDTALSLAGEIDDLTSTIQYVLQNGFEQIALYGHSLGARVCLEAFDSRYVKTMILTGAGTGPVSYDWTEEFTSEQLEELEATGYLTQPVEDPNRRSILISKQMLLDFEEMDQKKTLSNITVPTLIIHGDQGEEAVLLPITKKGMKHLPEASKLVVLEGAHHSFMDRLDDIEEHAIAWLHKHF